MAKKLHTKLDEKGLPRATLAMAFQSLLSIIWRADKAYYLIIFANGVLGAANKLINLALPKLLIDGFTQGWQMGQFVQGILLFVLLKYGILQAMALLKRQDNLHTELLWARVPMMFSQKIMALPYHHLEDPNILDLKERAIFPITNYGSLHQLLDAVISLLTGLLTLGGLITLLFLFSPVFLAALLALSLAAVLLSGRFSKYMREQMQQLIPVNRKYGYWSNTATGPQFQKEYRVFGLHQVMHSKITDYTDEITNWLRVMYTRQGNHEAFQALITTLMRVAAYGYAALRALSAQWGPQISLGDYTVVVMAAENFFSTFMSAFTGVFDIISATHHLMPFAQFMALPESHSQPGPAPAPLETLAFDQVSFTYPGGDRQILDTLSFTIKKGEKISIVGLNNAGKSTMVKLLCRLFAPTSGRILWNGVDISQYDYQAYLAQLSAVFQDFYLFPFTIRDNLDPEGHKQDAALHQALDQTGLSQTVEGLKNGLDTHFNKAIWEEATDLSGGEKQKLAIARSVLRPASLVILDEPTAALDPLAESEVYEHFHQLTQGRTAIFISHRMSSSTFCDKILLLKDGRLAAFDSHTNLMAGHNLYRELFMAQAQHFRTDENKAQAVEAL